MQLRRDLGGGLLWLWSSLLSAAPTMVPDAWRAVDALAAVSVEAAQVLDAPLHIDLATGEGAERCPPGAWTGQATFDNGADGALVYWGTGWYCIPHGVGTVQYPDGSTFFGRVTSFLAAADARILRDSFRPAVPDGPGQRFFPATGVQQLGVYARGQLVRDLGPDPAFVARYAAAVESLPDRTRPTLTPAVLAFFEVRPSVPNFPPAIPPVPGPARAVAPPAGAVAVPVNPASWEPKVVTRIEPTFPREALIKGLGGRVVVSFDVRGDGSVDPRSLEITRSEPRGLYDDAVRRALDRWRFSPAPDGDVTRRKRVEQTFNFRLDE
jgi:TonB family protein